MRSSVATRQSPFVENLAIRIAAPREARTPPRRSRDNIASRHGCFDVVVSHELPRSRGWSCLSLHVDGAKQVGKGAACRGGTDAGEKKETHRHNVPLLFYVLRACAHHYFFLAKCCTALYDVPFHAQSAAHLHTWVSFHFEIFLTLAKITEPRTPLHTRRDVSVTCL